MKNTIPEGTRDFTAEECLNRREILKVICNIFSSWGYKEVTTPTIEYYETFNHNTESLKEEEMYKFFDNTGRILVLRPDMTVPVARMVSTKLKDVKPPMRLFYTANIFRVNESLVGRRNEYIDCGVELVGVKEKYSDLEILVIALETLKAIGMKNFKLEIGNVNILKSAMEQMNLNEEQREKVAELINKKSLTTLANYLDTLNLTEEYYYFLTRLPWLFGGYEMIEETIEIAFCEEIKSSIEYLKKLYMSLRELGYEEFITVDMSIVPKVNYYTGIIFNGYIDGIGSIVLRGGRYDNLIKKFGRDLPAVGFSVDVNAMIDTYVYSNNVSQIEVEVDGSDLIQGFKKTLELTKQGQAVNIKYK